MRMILRAYPNEMNKSQCIFFLDGKYTIVNYSSSIGLSTDRDSSLGNYDYLVHYTNRWLVRNL